MSHFIEAYADRVNELLHRAGGARFFRQEIVEVPGLVTGLLITYDGVKDDTREIRTGLTYEEFLDRMALIKPDWKHFGRSNFEALSEKPDKAIKGWEGRTIYCLRGGSKPERWNREEATSDVIVLLLGAQVGLGPLIQSLVAEPRDWLPAGRDHFREYEHFVRVVWNYLFRAHLGEGQAQCRTEPEEQEGVEIRDLVFANQASSGFWKDLKDKYAASEIVVDAKNTDDRTRDDLRQLYCYLKPAGQFSSLASSRLLTWSSALPTNFVPAITGPQEPSHVNEAVDDPLILGPPVFSSIAITRGRWHPKFATCVGHGEPTAIAVRRRLPVGRHGKGRCLR